MGWGITIKNVYVSRVTKNEIDMQIGELRDYIKLCETKIAMMVAAPVSSLGKHDIEGNYMNWDEFVPNELLNMLYEYKEDVKRLHLLELAKDEETEEDN